MKLALIVLVGVILEVFVWIGVGDLVGSMWYVFFWFIAAFFIGMGLIRKHSAGLMPQMQQMQMSQINAADPALTGNLPKIIAGFFLLLPGLITDVLAVLILIPPVQQAFKTAMMNTMMKRQQAMMEKMMGGMGGPAGANPFEEMMRQMQDMQNQQNGQRGGDIIEGEAREVTPDAKKIEMKDVNPK